MSQTSTVRQLPAGYKMIPVRTIYLQMKRNPLTKRPAPPTGCVIRRWRRPPVKGYRQLFSAVGRKWGWSGRQILSDRKLAKTIADRSMEIFRLRCGNKTAGFVELDRCDPAQTEIVYLGLIPEFIGRGLGKYLLDWAIHRAWRSGPERIWLHTCAYDHPDALAVYLKAGFTVSAEKVEWQPYPTAFVEKLPPAGG